MCKQYSNLEAMLAIHNKSSKEKLVLWTQMCKCSGVARLAVSLRIFFSEIEY